jgi:MOSC domain
VIDGDGQGDLAGHGGEHRAVFVYQIDSYHYWQRQLGRDDFTYGQFGENFTIDGLPDQEVCIGDRYRIGQALFEVTQPARPRAFSVRWRRASVCRPRICSRFAPYYGPRRNTVQVVPIPRGFLAPDTQSS